MDVAAAVRRLPVLQELSDTTRERIIASAHVTQLRAGEALWERGEGAAAFTFLVDGQVRLIVEQPRVGGVLVDLVDAGALVCAPVACGAAPYCCRAVCARKSELLSIPRDELMREVRSSVADLLIAETTRRATTLCRRMREVGGSKIRRRVALLLLRLADDSGVAQGARVRLPAEVSRRDLAGLAGCATETLIREISRLEQAGALVREGRAILVDVAALSEQAYAK